MSDPKFFEEATAKAADPGPSAKQQGQRHGILDHLVWFADANPSLSGRKLVKGWLEAEQVSLVFGPPGCGKTFMMMDLALHVAGGRDWGGSKVRQGGVIYLAAEAGRSILNRVCAFKLHHKLENVVLPFAAVACSVDLCTPKKNDIKELTDLVTAAAKKMTVKPSLIIVDTVARAMAGGNENSPDDMGRFVKALDWLRDNLRCHIAVVHHIGKDRDRGARGHSSLFAAVDTAIEVEAADGVSTATIVKQRDGLSNVSKSFKLIPVTLGYDEDDDPVTSCVIQWTDAPVKEPMGQANEAFKLLKELLTTDDCKDGKATVEQWRKVYQHANRGKPPDTVQKAFNRAFKRLTGIGGWVEEKDGVVWVREQGQLDLGDDEKPF